MKKIICLVVIMLVISLPTFAEIKLGVHGGLSSGPDQIYGGVRADIGTLFPSINLVGIADIGVGEDITLLSAGGDLQYKLNFGGSIQPYIGVFIGFTQKLNGGGNGFGLAFPIGIKFNNSMFLEARIGFEDSPDLKICFGMFL